MTAADPQWFITKDKPITYVGIFIKLYNQKNCRQVHDIYRMIKLEKWRTLIVKNLRNLDTNYIV